MRYQLFHRTELLLGKDAMKRIQDAKVIIFGVGGVGSWCAEALVRTGVGHLSIVDSDVVCPTNVNRQLQATSHNIGKPKVDELRERLLTINPEADIKAFKVMYDDKTCDQFNLSEYDYVLDAIDTLRSKILLIRLSLEAGVKLYSSMGAGSK
ncbi:MAG: ThiF family adenylyltransferase, partial [Victivallales bacterium]